MFLPLMSLFMVAASASADTLATLRNVEVTAAPVSVVKSGAPVQHLGRVSLERLGDAGVSDAVKHFSGVTVNDYGGMGGLKTVSVRALGSKHTAVAYDGVPVTDAQSGDIDISRFRLDNVETLTLSTAGSDAIFRPARLYGSGATLAITSRRPDFTVAPLRARASVAGGSYGYVSPSARIAWAPGGNADYFVTVAADYLRSDGRYPFRVDNGAHPVIGKRKNSDVESVTAEMNLNLANVTVKGYYYNSERGLPGSVVFYNDYAAERLSDRNAFTQAVYKFSPLPGLTFRAIGKFNYTRSLYTDRRDIYPGGLRSELNTQRELYGSFGALWRPSAPLSLTIVTDLAGSDLHSDASASPRPRRLTWQSAAAASFFSRRFRATASLLATMINERVRSGAEPPDVRRLSPALSASWQPFADLGLHVRASVADGFRVPTFADRYYSRIGNVNLRPERSLQTNLGLTWTSDGGIGGSAVELNFSVDGYFNRVADKIVAIPTLYVWTMRNVGLARIGGLDVTAQAAIPLPAGITVDLQGAYSWQHAVDATSGSMTYGHRLPYTAAHSGSATLGATWRSLTLAYSVTATGLRFSNFRNGADSRMDPYADQSVSASWAFDLRRCSLQIRAELLNLADVNYQVIRYYPMPGRRCQFSVSITI